MDELQAKVLDLITQIENVSPDIAQAMLAAVQVDATRTLIFASIIMAIGFLFFVPGLILFVVGAKDDYDGDLMSLGFFVGMVGLVTSIVAGLTLVNPWLWTKLHDPEIYIAKLALAKLL